MIAESYQDLSKISSGHGKIVEAELSGEASTGKLTSPVALFVFNRPALTKRVLDRIAQAKPATLLVIADGPRSKAEEALCDETRNVVQRIDWDCQVLREYSEENLGCKRRVSSGIDWAFSLFEEVIILEDDCLPAPSFFSFCQTLLDYYRQDDRIFMISGDNFQFGHSRTSASYYFSRYPHIWGWASWRRAWKYFDVTMRSWPEFKSSGRIETIFENPLEQRYWTRIFDECYGNTINSWAYIWAYTCWLQGALAILPEVNLVSNIGFGFDATHTADQASPQANMPTDNIWKIVHPEVVSRHQQADAYSFENVFQP
jgi:hypothetical protein